MGFFKSIAVWAVVFLSCLGAYFLLGAIYDDYIKEGFPKLNILLFMPLGFCLLVSGTDHFIWGIIRLVGLGLLVIPALVFHIQCMNAVNEPALHQMPSIYCMFLPMACVAALAGYLGVGYETLAYVSKASLFICFCVGLVFSFITRYAHEVLFIIAIVISAIALLILGIKRLKEGSAFAY